MATTRRATAAKVAEQIPRPDAGATAASTPLTAYSSESGRTYRLDTLIGKGGFGEVYLATPTPQDTTVVINVPTAAAVVSTDSGL